MTIPYCLPIIKQTKREVLETLEANAAEYRFLEVWLDYVEDLDEAFVKTLTGTYKDKLVLLFRRQKLEHPQMVQETRNKYLSLLHGTQAYLDLDIKSQQTDLACISDNKLQTQLLLSYHNYETTPDAETLSGIITDMTKYNPAVYKLATFCNEETDALRLLTLLLRLKNEQKKYIILGMGEHGTITRVFGTLWGNMMIFAPKTIAGQSAPGQLTKGQLEKIFTELHHN